MLPPTPSGIIAQAQEQCLDNERLQLLLERVWYIAYVNGEAWGMLAQGPTHPNPFGPDTMTELRERAIAAMPDATWPLATG